jgi:hypothetical protein
MTSGPGVKMTADRSATARSALSRTPERSQNATQSEDPGRPRELARRPLCAL